MYQNIPMELRERRQWLVWRYETMPNGRRTKVPYTPQGAHASVNDPHTWTDFTTAVECAKAPNVDGIGFVLTAGDPYCIIDLDNKAEKPISAEEWKTHERILNQFHTFTERSVSGRGYHIVLRGTLARGRRRDNVEVYSSERYMAFTGDVVRNAPIVEYQTLLDALVAEMPEVSAAVDLEDVESQIDDQELHDMAINAVNGEKYDQLCRGDWQAMGYTSQSEADFALLSILAFYTRDNAQVLRMFRYSALGKREKATKNDSYLNRNLQKIRAGQPRAADYDAIAATVAGLKFDNGPASEDPSDAQVLDSILFGVPLPPPPGAVPPPPPPVANRAPPPPKVNVPKPPSTTDTPYPPGLIGRLARYFYSTAIRPVNEMCLATAIGLMAGVVGRSYNISGTGLNQYLLFVANTGTGKEGAGTIVNQLLSAVRPTVPMVDEFVGPGTFASGQALVRALDARPCFLSLMGEFGLTLQQLNDPRAPSSTIMLKRVLLDLYSKSGWNSMLRSTAYSDQEKNTNTIHAPNVTILGDTTPETFYDSISTADIADGLIPRFHIMEYNGTRPKRNRNAGCPPDANLVHDFGHLAGLALTMQANRSCAAVQTTDDALALLDAFDEECDGYINDATNSGERQLWNRGHLKALKLAALVAVGCHPQAPCVDKAIAEWAIAFTRKGVHAVLNRFETGNIGTGEMKQESELMRVVKEYFGYSVSDLARYKLDPAWQKAGVIPYAYFQRRLSRVACFYRDRVGSARAIKATLDVAVQTELLSLVPPVECQRKFGTTQAMYYPHERSWRK